MNSIPTDDEKTFDLLRAADTLGIFQLESDGMRRMIKEMKIDCFDDLVAALAMYRPGPLNSGMVDQYIKSKNGLMETTYLHPMLKDVLRETYGVVLYQEQVMQCATILAGYSLGGADLLRRAMGKKKLDVMAKERTKFVSGCETRNISAADAERIFDVIQKFAEYGFNKSHSAAYAFVTYQTAWLKAHYCVAFMAAYLSSQMKSKKEIMADYVRDVRISGIDVLAPDVNSSRASFTAVGDVIRFGLSAVSRVGDSAVEAILKAREKGPFTSFWDFMSRVDVRAVGKNAIENLIYAGAFDSLCPNRARVVSALPDFYNAVTALNDEREQASLFDADDIAVDEPVMSEVADMSQLEKLEKEKEVMGIYISGHPYDQYAQRFRQHSLCRIADLSSWCASFPPKVGGIIAAVTEKRTKKGDLMGVMTLEDDNANIEVVCFPKNWEQARAQISVGHPYIIEGDYKTDREPHNIILNKITLLEDFDDDPPIVRVKFFAEQISDDGSLFKELGCRLKEFRGSSPVVFEIVNESVNGESSYTYSLSSDKVSASTVNEMSESFAEVLSSSAFEISA